MQVQVSTDSHVTGSQALEAQLEADLRLALARFSGSITRLEVRFSDLNSGAKGGADKRCVIEAPLTGRQPQSVSHEAQDLRLAAAGAIDKLVAALQSTLDRAAARERMAARSGKNDV